MATLYPSSPLPAGALAAFAAIGDDDDEVSLDVEDLVVTTTLVNAGGVAQPAAGWDRDTGDTRLRFWPPADLPPGRYLLTASVGSATAGLSQVVHANAEVGGHPYGSSVAGVEALLSDLTITYRSNPSAADVGAWLDSLGAQLAARLVGVDDLPDDIAAGIGSAAAAVLHLGAASYADDAAHPDRVTPKGDSRYAAVLWARYTTAAAELVAEVAQARAAAGLSPVAGVRHAGASFPPPLWRRDTGI